MAKRPSLSLAKPRGATVGGTAERVDVLERALTEAAPKAPEPAPKKAQRSREGMVSTNLWLSPEARKQLKLHCYAKDEGLEQFILRAVNAQLEAEGVTFRIS